VATVFVTTVADGHLQQLAFCQVHAEQTGVLEPCAYGYSDAGPQGLAERLRRAAVCPLCQATLAVIQQRNHAGCAQCYVLFQGYFRTLLPLSHKGRQHLGKVPRLCLTPVAIRQRIAFLEKCLSLTIAQEQFEDAAQIRDCLLRYKALLTSGILQPAPDKDGS
jgi:protein arginine kinase activator